jgi:hypothetical protein
VLPHCEHLLSPEACHRLAALRVRRRIFEVLRFGTPMAGGYESRFTRKNNGWVADSSKNYNVTRPEMEMVVSTIGAG